MHRSYQPTKPSTNKVLAKRWDEQKFSSHRDRVREAKPMVDTRPPKVQSHLAVKMKKLQLEEERNAVIDRDNRMLMERMTQIMKTSGRIDARNDYEHKSLNKEKRQRELMTILQDNERMVDRLKGRTQKPNYDNAKMAVDWERKKDYAKSIAQYPPDWYQQMEMSGQVRRHSSLGGVALSQAGPPTSYRTKEPLPPIGHGKHSSEGAGAAAAYLPEEDEDEYDGEQGYSTATPVKSASATPASASGVGPSASGGEGTSTPAPEQGEQATTTDDNADESRTTTAQGGESPSRPDSAQSKASKASQASKASKASKASHSSSAN